MCPVQSDDDNNKPKRNWSPEAREKMSRLAKERHARGELGGSKFGKMGGRPRKDRVAKRIADAAQDEAMFRKILEVFKDGIDNSQPMQIRLKAAEALIALEREESKVQIAEAREEGQHKSREELIAALKEKLGPGSPTSIMLSKQIEQETGITDAEVVDDNG